VITVWLDLLLSPRLHAPVFCEGDNLVCTGVASRIDSCNGSTPAALAGGGTDGLFQIASPPGDVTLLHFPSLYPFLSRLPILLVSAWCNAGHLHSLQLGVKRWVALNDTGLLLLVAGQQLALIFALALLTVSCTRRPILRCLIVVVFLCTPVLFIGAQLISSEALASILLILLIAIAVELSRAQELSRNGIIALGVCLYANVMTRHINAIGAALVPMAYLLGAITHTKKRGEGRICLKKLW